MRAVPPIAVAAMLVLACHSSTAAPREAAQGPRPTPAPSALVKELRLTKVAGGLRRPVLVIAAPGEPARLYAVEQPGAIRVIEGGAVKKERFLDLAGKVSTSGEQGLLGLAFHPRYQENRKLYVHYTDRRGDTRIVEYRANPERTAVDPASARVLLEVDQPYANHNGGHLVFGPDGKLYTGLGDGGSAGDPKGSGQNRNTYLGKLLRIDVDGRGAAAGKPTTAAGRAPRATPAAELVHWGLRNPWRFDFDRATGDLFIGDVGQGAWEEVDVIAGDDPRNHNLGWNVHEGFHCYGAARCERAGFTPPAVEYSHDEGCSITGGVVYRGKAIPELAGAFFFADYCTGLLRSLRWSRDPDDKAAGSGKATGAVRDYWEWRGELAGAQQLSQISSFGADADGELLLVSLTGSVWRLERRSPAAPPSR